MQRFDHNTADETLVAQVLAGARDAFGLLVERYQPSVLRLCVRLLGSTFEAQDVAQEAVIQAFLQLHTLQDPARFGAWLHAIAANNARMTLRRRRLLSLEALPAATLLAAQNAMPTPEDVQHVRAIHDAIIAAINELPATQREVVIHFYLDGYRYAELAALLDVPISTVKGRLFKGRSQLRRTLALVASEILNPDRRPRKERPMTPDVVPATLEDIRVSSYNNEHTIAVLRVADGRIIPIFIGPAEAAAISNALQQISMPRPMTHDLAVTCIETLNARLARVTVNKLAESTFYAEMTLVQGQQTFSVDARPSDALAMAARTGTPIFVAQSVLDSAGGQDDALFWAKVNERIRLFEANMAQFRAAAARQEPES